MNQTEHAETTVYLSLDASTMVASKQVHIEDIASVFCSQPDIMHDVKKIKLFTFRDNEQGQLVVNALAIIGEILKYDKSVTVQNIGSQECVVYYRNLSDGHKRTGKIKAAFLMLLAFFGQDEWKKRVFFQHQSWRYAGRYKCVPEEASVCI